MLRVPASRAAPALTPAEAADPLLDMIGPLADARVLVIGHDLLETTCALIHRGCAAATEMRADACPAPEHESADAVLVPRVASAAEAAQAIACAARALTPGGYLALRDVTGGLRQSIATLLRGHGLSGMRVRMTRAGILIGAARPMFGLLQRA